MPWPSDPAHLAVDEEVEELDAQRAVVLAPQLDLTEAVRRRRHESQLRVNKGLAVGKGLSTAAGLPIWTPWGACRVPLLKHP